MNPYAMRCAAVLALACAASTAGCQPRGRAAGGEGATAIAGADRDALAALTAYTEASVGPQREKLRSLVLMPTDPRRRQWVTELLSEGEGPPPGTTAVSQAVTMDGPVAVGRVEYRLPDGSVEPSPPGFLVRRDGRWKVVVDYFEGGDLTRAEMEVIGRHLDGM